MQLCLARWLSWLECCPMHPKAVGLIPGQGICLVHRFNPCSGLIQEATYQCFSLTSMCFFLSLPSILSKINKHMLREGSLKCNRILIHATTWLNLENVTLRNKLDAKGQMWYGCTYMRYFE